VPLALFDVLDAAPASRDYVARVEPSARGGAKMAEAILRAVDEALARGGCAAPGVGEAPPAAAPHAAR
jgi:hypothetical protein